MVASNSKLNVNKNKFLKTTDHLIKQSYNNLPSYKKINSKIFDNDNINLSIDKQENNINRKPSKFDQDYRNKLKQIQNSTKPNINSFKESFSKKYYINKAEKNNLINSQKKIVLSSVDRIQNSNKIVKVRKKKKNNLT